MMPPVFLQSANKLTYYFAIPAMMLKAIAGSNFSEQFNIDLLLGTVLPLFLVYILAWIGTILIGLDKASRGTFIESTMHGNIGYVGFAVVFYYLGADAFVRAGILGGFMMLIHNFLAVVVLQYYATNTDTAFDLGQTVKMIIGNPIIVTAIVGIMLSVFSIPLPEIVSRTLGIIGNLALPLALLVIGASLSFQMRMKHLLIVFLACLFKLILLPVLGLWYYNFADLTRELYLPGLILLTSPVATVVFILASEMRGDAKLAVTIISTSTALSAVSIPIWLGLTL